jgi:hypothetical protein
MSYEKPQSVREQFAAIRANLGLCVPEAYVSEEVAAKLRGDLEEAAKFAYSEMYDRRNAQGGRLLGLVLAV